MDTEIFDVLVKDTGRTKQELHDWAKTENELKEICTPEEIAGDEALPALSVSLLKPVSGTAEELDAWVAPHRDL